ncbi:MAG: hypothetical protein ACR2OZ_08150 [Verrucomicrobiales bacterium]
MILVLSGLALGIIRNARVVGSIPTTGSREFGNETVTNGTGNTKTKSKQPRGNKKRNFLGGAGIFSTFCRVIRDNRITMEPLRYTPADPRRKIKERDCHSAWSMHYLSGLPWREVAEVMTFPERPLRAAVNAWIETEEGRKVIVRA